MNAHYLSRQNQTVASEIDACLLQLFDAQARQHITVAWAAGKIDGDEALGLLIELDLIEVGNG